jgi:hypothetical protein
LVRYRIFKPKNHLLTVRQSADEGRCGAKRAWESMRRICGSLGATKSRWAGAMMRSILPIISTTTMTFCRP